MTERNLPTRPSPSTSPPAASATTPRRPRIVLAGGVESSRLTLGRLLDHGANVAAVLGLHAGAAPNTSGYARLDDLAAAARVPYHDFVSINTPAAVEVARRAAPDLLFVVGLSQLIGPELLALPALGCVGFHPTRLPEGRGRAPVAWLTLEGRGGAATFFAIDQGVDSGPILAQEPFEVSPGDYAADVSRKLYEAMERALDRWLPRLLAGEWSPVPQDEARATYYGRRAPEDGRIDWSASAEEICALVRASSHPHPGGYTFADGVKLLVWKAEPAAGLPWKGAVGRILIRDAGGRWLVQSGRGLVWLSEVQVEAPGQDAQRLLRVGRRLGITAEDEVVRLRDSLAAMEQRLSELERRVRET